MKQIKLITIFILLSVFSFTSCTTEETIEGHDITTGTDDIIGWNKSSVTESYFTNVGTLENYYPVNVLGGRDGSPTKSDIVVDITIDPASTAINGQEYTLPMNSLIIPAGSSYVDVPVNINTGNLNPIEPTFVLLNISTLGNAVVSSRAYQMKINFVGCKSLLADYTYNVTITRENTGETYDAFGENITMTSVNNFRTATVMHFGLTPGVTFEDICGNLYMPTTQDLSIYSNQVTPAGGPSNLAGTVDSTTGNFTLRYLISGASSTTGDWGYYTAEYIRN